MSIRRPRWWLLYGLAAVMMAALIWVHRLGLADKIEMVFQVCVLVVTFGLVSLWLNANGPALLNDVDAAEPDPYLARTPLAGGGRDRAILGEGQEPAAQLEPAAAPERETASGYRGAAPVIAGSVLD